MPKINGAGRPSYAGHEGIVENALGERHELDPSRNDDGTVVDGYESDERELSDRDADPAVSDRPIPLAETEQQEQRPDERAGERSQRGEHGPELADLPTGTTVHSRKEQPSAGNSSSASATKPVPSSKRSNGGK